MATVGRTLEIDMIGLLTKPPVVHRSLPRLCVHLKGTHLKMLQGCIKANNGDSSVLPKMDTVRILSEGRGAILPKIERPKHVWNTLENHEQSGEEGQARSIRQHYS